MTRFIQEGPLWRQALIAMAAMLGFSAVFIGVVMLALGSIVDMAVAPSSPDDGVDTVKAATASGSKSKDQPSRTKGPNAPGEQS